MRMGTPPNTSVKIQAYPGISTTYNPHESLTIYREKIKKEADARSSPATQQWFREERRRRKAREEQMAAIDRWQLTRSASSPSTLGVAGAASLGKMQADASHFADADGELRRGGFPW